MTFISSRIMPNYDDEVYKLLPLIGEWPSLWHSYQHCVMKEYGPPLLDSGFSSQKYGVVTISKPKNTGSPH